jgi:hypothetical protein
VRRRYVELDVIVVVCSKGIDVGLPLDKNGAPVESIIVGPVE